MKKVIALAIASAMVAPAAFAAEDDHGMRYTSASEGLYMSIRTEFQSRDDRYTRTDLKDESSSINNGNGRWGIQGSNDLGNGLEGFYRYEVGLGANNLRLRYVGLSGAFGDFRAGQAWANTYNLVQSKSDMSPNDSARFAWDFRIANSAFYLTPDLNGFQAGLRLTLDPEGDNAITGVSTATATKGRLLEGTYNQGNNVGAGDSAGVQRAERTDNQFDEIALVGQYSIAGFNVAGAYERTVDGLAPGRFFNQARATTATPRGTFAIPGIGTTVLTRDDRDRWSVGASYAQDNWYVGGWYGEQEQRNVSQGTAAANAVAYRAATSSQAGVAAKAAVLETAGRNWNKDVETFSLGGSVTVDKVVVFATWEQQDNNYADGSGDAAQGYFEDSGANVGVIYNLGSKSRVWVEYVSEDNDNAADIEDSVLIGLRHNF